MATSPPLSPVVATPLGHRKRRYSEMTAGAPVAADDSVEHKRATNVLGHGINGDHEVSQTGDIHSPINEQSEEEDDEDAPDEDEQTLVEDILDHAELDPYPLEGNNLNMCKMIDEEVSLTKEAELNGQPTLSAEAASKLRAHLLQVGPEQFFQDMAKDQMPPVVWGTAFGLDPYLEEQLGDDMFMRILGHAVVRFFRKRQKLPQYNTIDDAAELLRKSDNIMVITGAGISTSLGIPDFRSKGTGFYSKLLEAGISEPEEVFDIFEFDHDPGTFYKLAHGILPDETRFSPTHAFIRLLQDKGKLQTNYTQNIDNIEERAGIDRRRLIQCHGSFATATCRKCKYQARGADVFPDIRAQRIAYCPRCVQDIATMESAPKKQTKRRRFDSDSSSNEDDDDIPQPGVMKPDITFFGEQLPDTFFDRLTERDSKTVDLVLVIGTSLKVAPVSEIPNYLPHAVPHVYISREPIEHVNFDVQLLGDCDAVVWELCRRAGWALTHEMIPEGLVVRVEGVEGCESRWRLKADGDESRGGAVEGDAKLDGKDVVDAMPATTPVTL